jgi:hypothetical protein
MKSILRTLRPIGKWVGLVLSVWVLAGCNLPSLGNITGTTATPALQPSLQNTPTVITPAVTVALPTATAIAPMRVVFTKGATAAVEQGTIQPGQRVDYILGAEASQPMILLLGSTNQDATLAVSEANGNVLLDASKKYDAWQFSLPTTEDYAIHVIGGRAAENFTLTIKIASRINFASGAVTAGVSGSTVSGYVVSYAIYCKSGQTMTLALSAPVNSAHLDVFGLAYGQLLLKESANAASWVGSLPSTQDYVIEVIPNAGQVLSYSLTVTVR